MNIHPLGQRVLVKRSDITKIGTLYVPKGSQEMQCNLGKVIAVGPDCVFLQEGDFITFGRYAPLKLLPQEFKLYDIPFPFEDDTTYLLMNEADALCLIAEEMPIRNTLPESEDD